MDPSVKVALPDLGAASELQNRVWLNTEQPLGLAELRGKVVLLEMWTFGCINCQRVIPHLRDWCERYQEEGLVVLGNHYNHIGEGNYAETEAAIQALLAERYP